MWEAYWWDTWDHGPAFAPPPSPPSKFYTAHNNVINRFSQPFVRKNHTYMGSSHRRLHHALQAVCSSVCLSQIGLC